MRKLKSILGIALLSTFIFISCQEEEDVMVGDDPNQSADTNSADSSTSNFLARNTANDGSDDDILDGSSCSTIILPVIAEVNGQELAITNQSDFALITNIFAELTNDDDTVTLQFPFTVMLSNYTELVITNQQEFEELQQVCEEADQTEEDAISCLEIDYPITVLTFDANSEQTGSVVLEGNQQAYAFVENLDEDDFFSISYPLTLMAEGSSSTTVTSDAELENALEGCEAEDDLQEELENEAKVKADQLEDILTDTTFKVESGIDAGVEFTEDFLDFTFEFKNDGEVIVKNTLTNLIEELEGEFDVESDTNVVLELSFLSNSNFEILNNQYEVVNQADGRIELQSTTNANLSLILSQIE